MHSSTQRLTRGLVATFALICLTLGLAAHPAHAQAGYTTYTINDDYFNIVGSGSVSGYFDLDPTTDQLGNFDIVTSPGTDYYYNSYPGYTYDNSDITRDYSNGIVLDLFTGGVDAHEQAIGFVFGNLTNSGSENLVTIEGIGSGTGIAGFRVGDLGTLTAVPELSPLAAVALLSVLGCGALGVAGVKRRRGVTLA